MQENKKSLSTIRKLNIVFVAIAVVLFAGTLLFSDAFSLEYLPEMTDFDMNLTSIANDYLDESVRKMESISNVLNSIGIMLVSAIIAWVVLGTFQMQDQITAALS